MIEREPFRVRLAEPIHTAHGTIREREGFLVSVHYDGHYGVGEAAPLPGWTESYEECRQALDRAEAIAGELDWGMALAKIDAPAARHALSLAFVESRARKQDLPVYQSLGGERQVESVPVNATVGAGTSPAQTAHRARELVAEGFRTLKLKVGTNGLEDDVERVRSVRDAVGDDIGIRVDANGSWTLEQAKQVVEALGALGVEYVEQPLPKADLDGHAQLREATGTEQRERGVEIALDESLLAYTVDDVIQTDAADVAVLKPMVLGGPDRTLEAARRFQEAGIDPVLSTTFDAVVARTGAVHVAASIPQVRSCGLATASVLETDLASDPAPVRNGQITVPQSSGLGLPERL